MDLKFLKYERNLNFYYSKNDFLKTLLSFNKNHFTSNVSLATITNQHPTPKKTQKTIIAHSTTPFSVLYLFFKSQSPQINQKSLTTSKI